MTKIEMKVKKPNKQMNKQTDKQIHFPSSNPAAANT